MMFYDKIKTLKWFLHFSWFLPFGPDIIGGDAHGLHEAAKLTFGDGLLHILR